MQVRNQSICSRRSYCFISGLAASRHTGRATSDNSLADAMVPCSVPHSSNGRGALSLNHAIRTAHKSKGVPMTTNQSQPGSAATTGTRFPARLPPSRVRGSAQTFPSEMISTKVHVAGIRSAFAVLLSLAGIGSAMGQSSDQDMWMRANMQAARERAISEIRQARSDGTIRRWSPAFIEIQLQRHRTAPYAAQRDYPGDPGELARVSPATKAPVLAPDSRDIPIAAAE